jgi:hypothetical protein
MSKTALAGGRREQAPATAPECRSGVRPALAYGLRQRSLVWRQAARAAWPLAAALLVTACGGTTGSSAPSVQSSGATTAASQSRGASSPVITINGIRTASVEYAILQHSPLPRPTAASCRAPTAAEQTKSPVGGTGSTLFSCSITVEPAPAQFYVEVLPNGCFVAERQRPGRAIYGCGVHRGSTP